MNQDKYFKNIDKKDIFPKGTETGVAPSFAITDYLQKRRFVIMVTGNTYKDVLPKAWYADECYKWTAKDIYECKYNGKSVSEAFAQHVVSNLLTSSGALYHIHAIIACV